eukprot:gene17318-19867_t
MFKLVFHILLTFIRPAVVTAGGVRLPGEIAYGVPFASVKNGLAALETIPAAGIAQIIAFIGLLEVGFAA